MIRIITALGVSKSCLYPSKNKNEGQIKISEFKEYLKELHLEVCSDRPTFGYPRVTAIINRINKTKGFLGKGKTLSKEEIRKAWIHQAKRQHYFVGSHRLMLLLCVYLHELELSFK
jgi:hypothetical protein